MKEYCMKYKILNLMMLLSCVVFAQQGVPVRLQGTFLQNEIPIMDSVNPRLLIPSGIVLSNLTTLSTNVDVITSTLKLSALPTEIINTANSNIADRGYTELSRQTLIPHDGSGDPATITITGAGTAGANGIYTYAGVSNGASYYTKSGWKIYKAEHPYRIAFAIYDTANRYITSTVSVTNLWDLGSNNRGYGWERMSGTNPAPTSTCSSVAIGGIDITWSQPTIEWFYKCKNDFPSLTNIVSPRYLMRNTNNLLNIDLTAFSIGNSALKNLKGGTLIARKYVLGANHYSLNVGDTLYFVGTGNLVWSNNIAKKAVISGDICLYELTTNAPAHISVCEILPSYWSYYISSRYYFKNLPVFYIDQMKVIQKAFMSDSPKLFRLNDAVEGDSGSPLFFVIKNKPVLISLLHYSTSGDPVYDYIPLINAQIAAWGETQTVTVANLSSYDYTAVEQITIDNNTYLPVHGTVNISSTNFPFINTNAILNTTGTNTDKVISQSGMTSILTNYTKSRVVLVTDMGSATMSNGQSSAFVYFPMMYNTGISTQITNIKVSGIIRTNDNISFNSVSNLQFVFFVGGFSGGYNTTNFYPVDIISSGSWPGQRGYAFIITNTINLPLYSSTVYDQPKFGICLKNNNGSVVTNSLFRMSFEFLNIGE